MDSLPWRKYRNKPTEVDNIRFDSRREAKRYQELKLLQQAKVITDLKCEKPELRFSLMVNGVLICKYEADFIYTENGKQVVEDAKGVKTPVYRLKKKLMKAIYGIDVKEV